MSQKGVGDERAAKRVLRKERDLPPALREALRKWAGGQGGGWLPTGRVSRGPLGGRGSGGGQVGLGPGIHKRKAVSGGRMPGAVRGGGQTEGRFSKCSWTGSLEFLP